MLKTKIDWCQSTWSPVSGCLHGCEYCYARKIAQRLGGIKIGNFNGNICELEEPFRRSLDGKINPYPYEFMPTFHRYRLNDYIDKKGRNIFVCSMADLFGGWVPNKWIEQVFAACEKAPQHNYLFLTKNPQRYLDLGRDGKLPEKENMWYGSTITDPDMNAFFSECHQTFWSIEPILGPFGKIKGSKETLPNWIIVGAETGRRKDRVIPKREWIENILKECRKHSISLFMKSSLLDIWGEPLIQEFPEGIRKFTS